jgi:hypothetical protein
VDGNEQFGTGSMRMLSARLSGWHVADPEGALWQERQFGMLRHTKCAARVAVVGERKHTVSVR